VKEHTHPEPTRALTRTLTLTLNPTGQDRRPYLTTGSSLLHGTAPPRPRNSSAPPSSMGAASQACRRSGIPTVPPARASSPPRVHSTAVRSRTGEHARRRGDPRRRHAFGRRREEEAGEAGGRSGRRRGRNASRVCGERAADRGFDPAATAGRPSDLSRRPQRDKGRAGRLRPRRGAAFPAQAQVAAWCAGKRPARAVAALGRASLGRSGPI
jgi:hypothetical protein